MFFTLLIVIMIITIIVMIITNINEATSRKLYYLINLDF